MRGSFGGGYRVGRGGAGVGGSGGDGVLRTVGRVVRTGINGGSIQDPVQSSSSSTSPTRKSSATKTTQKPTTSKDALILSSTSISNNNSNNSLLPLPVSAAWPPPPCFPADYSEFDGQWECVENYFEDPVFGSVPSAQEVEHALFSLQRVILPISPSSSATGETTYQVDEEAADVVQMALSKDSDVMDWVEPSMQICDQRFAQSCGWERVYDAFHLLQTEPSVQKMVVSLSSDKAVWDAILNNEAVREIRESYHNAAETSFGSSNENSSPSNTNPNVLMWMFDNMKAKLLEVIGNITEFVGEIFKPHVPNEAEHSGTFSEKLKSTFLLTVVVLLIVVVTRGHMA